MDDLYWNRLEESGVDVSTALKRFMGDEALYRRFLEKFLNDPNYSNLFLNLEQKNYEQAFRCAHTVKGVAANLGLTSMYKAVAEMTELLRDKTADEVDTEALNEISNNVKGIYNALSELIMSN